MAHGGYKQVLGLEILPSTDLPTLRIYPDENEWYDLQEVYFNKGLNIVECSCSEDTQRKNNEDSFSKGSSIVDSPCSDIETVFKIYHQYYNSAKSRHSKECSFPGIPPNVIKGVSQQRSNSQGSDTSSYNERDSCYWGREHRQNVSGGFEGWHSPGSSDGYYEGHSMSTHTPQNEKDFEEPDYRHKGREPFKDIQKSELRENKEKAPKPSSWAREYDERFSDPFDVSHESSREKHLPKERNEQCKREKLEKERPPRPDSRDSRASTDSIKDERLYVHSDSSLPGRKRKSASREEKKEKSSLLDWGVSPYPVEPKNKDAVGLKQFILREECHVNVQGS